MVNLLYVCDANINRSPAAKIITLEKAKGLDLVVSSAGLYDYSNKRMTDEMLRALERRGYYIDLHKPHRLTLEELERQDIVLCFEESQVEELLTLSPGIENRVSTLPKFAGLTGEILSWSIYYR